MAARPIHPRLVLSGAVVAAALLFALASWRDARQISRGTERLMLAQARTIADLVEESWTHGAEVHRLWEEEVGARLLDNARWVARQDSLRPLTAAELSRLAALHQLGRINLFDARGEKTASSVVESESSLTPRHDPRDFIGPILRGERRELLIGFKPARFRGGSRFAVAVARRRGGAVVVNVFADSMRRVLESVQPRHLLGMLGSANGVRYLALVTPDSAIVSGPNVPEPAWPSGFRAGTAPDADHALVRELRTPTGHVYEVTRAVNYGGPALLRVGLDARPLEQARADVRRRAWLRSAMFLAISLLLGALLLVWQRHEVLAREVARARSELEMREQERMRGARLEAMEEMAAHVAHEIRNPLNTIHMIAQEMSRHPAPAEAFQAQAADIRAESQRIEGIVQQFLDLSRPRAPEPVPTDVAEIVESAARAARPAFAAEQVELVVRAEPVRAVLDPLLLREILENLLRNAREASPPRTCVTARCGRHGGQVRITVEDQGPGVPAELRERIFDLYFTTKSSGSGLGLSLAARMAGAMSGSLRLEDSAAGARFVLRFPLEGERS
jgi:signal transduction histidine kinase